MRLALFIGPETIDGKKIHIVHNLGSYVPLLFSYNIHPINNLMLEM